MSNEADSHTERDEEHLAPLAVRFMHALERRRAGQIDRATEDLRAILRVEPRLARIHKDWVRVPQNLNPERLLPLIVRYKLGTKV